MLQTDLFDLEFHCGSVGQTSQGVKRITQSMELRFRIPLSPPANALNFLSIPSDPRVLRNPNNLREI